MTGNFQTWAGTISEIGPLYPFVGSEVLLWILGMVFWIGWQVLQLRMEKRQIDEEVRGLRQGDTLQRIIQAEHATEQI
jgi:hypothetical protein